jgi:minor histocompatibility antigen H13
MMITVATSLDVPIKLVFPGGGMLGLGDIVLPGLMIAIAHRFDLYLHYLRQPASATSSSSSPPSSKTKPVYHPATGNWGERYWMSSLKRSALPSHLGGSMFKKTYFHASLVGYAIGMIATYTVLIVFKHGQPALMYLVPTVLFSLWFTAAVRGDLAEMWSYTEDGEVDDKAAVQGKAAENQTNPEERVKAIEEKVEINENSCTSSGQNCTGVLQSSNSIRGGPRGIDERAKNVEAYRKGEDRGTSAEKSSGCVRQTETPAKDSPHHVFLFSLYAPPRGPARKRNVI